jgi:hypothetical protein
MDLRFVKAFGIAPPSSLSHFHMGPMYQGAKFKTRKKSGMVMAWSDREEDEKNNRMNCIFV